MKAMIVAGLLALSAIPLAAHAEGNGPAFPGLQNPDLGITTMGGAGTGTVDETMDHSANAYAIGTGSWNAAPKAPAGLTRAQLARRAHTWQMLDDNSGGAG